MIETPSAAALLADPEAFRFFAPFLAQTCTAGQAAQRAGSRIDTMMYRIERYLQAGLIELVPGVTPRSRKRYRSVTDRFVVPFEATYFESLVELLLGHDASQQRLFAEALVAAVAGDGGGWMLRIHRDDAHGRRGITVDAAPSGQLDWHMTQMLAPGTPATWYTTQAIFLDAACAKELQGDLLALWQKYDARRSSGPTGEPRVKHVLQLQLAPVGGPEIDTGRKE